MNKKARKETKVLRFTDYDYSDAYDLLSDYTAPLSSHDSTATLTSNNSETALSSNSSSKQSSKANLTAFFSAEEMLAAKKRIEARLTPVPTSTDFTNAPSLVPHNNEIASSSNSSSKQGSKANLTAFFSTEEMLETEKRVKSQLTPGPTSTDSDSTSLMDCS